MSGPDQPSPKPGALAPVLRLAEIPGASGAEPPTEPGEVAGPTEAELALWTRRGAGELSPEEREALWRGVERGLAKQAGRSLTRRFVLGASAAGLAAAAAALFVVTHHSAGRPPPVLEDLAAAPIVGVPTIEAAAAEDLDPVAIAALDAAEQQSREASRALEAEVVVRMAVVGEAQAKGLERALAPVRKRLDSARLLAENDVEGRLRVLSNEARYLRSLTRALRFAEEAAP